MKFLIPQYRFLSAIVCMIAAVEASVGTIADSVADFEPNGGQGVDGWTYGYRIYRADGGGNDHGVSDFIPFTSAEGWAWTDPNDTILLPPGSWNRIGLNGNRTVQAAQIPLPAPRIVCSYSPSGNALPSLGNDQFLVLELI